MAPPKKMQTGEEIVRLMVINLRRTARTQAEVVIELDRAGFGPSRIADLLSTTPNAVNVTLNKAKKRQAEGDHGHES
jgi:DNA-directed RNA polymerase specialized sigma24 family protein